MINKKCFLSFGGFATTLFISLLTMHLMSLFTLSKWVGVGVGIGVMVFMLVLALVLRKGNGEIHYLIIPVNAVGEGLAASSMFVYLGSFPKVWESAAVFGGLCALFLLYILLTNIPLFRDHFVICMTAFVLIILAGLIAGEELTKSNTFYLALLSMIPFISFLVTTATKAENANRHIRNLSYSSFAALIIVIIVVLIVISGGDGLDGVGDAAIVDGTGKAKKQRQNPYDFYIGKL